MGERSRFLRSGCILAVVLAGCGAQPGSRPIALNDAPPLGPRTAMLLPASTYHLVTVRQRDPDPNAPQDVLCTEPSPDWAMAYGHNLSGGASGGSGGVTLALNASTTSTQAVTPLDGRTAGVVALRDGLYAACQAYANHAIGRDAYALILSQYGDLLVALAGGAGTGTASAAPAASPGGVAVNVSTGSGGTPAKSAGGSAGGAASPSPASAHAFQALLVSCISSSDPTLPDNSNRFLRAVCDKLAAAMDQALPSLMGVPSTPAARVPPPRRRPALGKG